jgi:N6-L-threonylcarbamoyladenine synthase
MDAGVVGEEGGSVHASSLPAAASAYPAAVRILGIDTSCDDTGVGIVDGGLVVANVVASQAAVHAPFGGVMPEHASREHLSVIDAVVGRALDEAGLAPRDLDAVAATYGPGLAGALLVGLSYAKGLAWALGVPFVKVHHLEGHIAASVGGGPGGAGALQPPFLCLIASGGHTVLFDVPALGHYVPVGRSLDDAAGEAFDKVARLLGLGYPGGPALAALATEGDPHAVDLPVPLAGRGGYDLSFSGLKTAVAVRLERDPTLAKADVAAAFERRAVDHLVTVARRAARDLGRRDLVVAGGVAANARLRAALAEAGLRVHLPPPGLATDNGAMIALAAERRLAAGPADPADLATDAAPYLPLAGTSGRPRDVTRGET